MPMDPILLLNFIARFFDNDHPIVGFFNATGRRCLATGCKGCGI